MKIMLKNSQYKYAIVRADWYHRYGCNAFIEYQAQTDSFEEANHICVSFENADKKEYYIINVKDEKNGEDNYD